MGNILLLYQPPCPPFSACWCSTRPNHPRCKPIGVPIDNGISILIIGAILLAIYFRKKLRYA